MSVFTKYQKARRIDWEINTEKFPYVKCSELELEKTYPIYGMFISPDFGYGENPIVILEDKLLSLPPRYLEEVKNYLADPEVVAKVKAHETGVVITTFESKKFKKTGYDVDFIELS